MIIAFSSIKKSDRDDLVSSDGIAQFCGEDDGSGSSAHGAHGAIRITSDAIDTGAAQIELFVRRRVIGISIGGDVGEAPFGAQSQLFPGFRIPVHLSDLLEIVKIAHQQTTGQL